MARLRARCHVLPPVFLLLSPEYITGGLGLVRFLRPPGTFGRRSWAVRPLWSGTGTTISRPGSLRGRLWPCNRAHFSVQKMRMTLNKAHQQTFASWSKLMADWEKLKYLIAPPKWRRSFRRQRPTGGSGRQVLVIDWTRSTPSHSQSNHSLVDISEILHVHKLCIQPGHCIDIKIWVRPEASFWMVCLPYLWVVLPGVCFSLAGLSLSPRPLEIWNIWLACETRVCLM